MTTPYVLPQMLEDAPLGIDWSSVGSNPNDPNDNLAALLDVCWVATNACDNTAQQPIHATVDVDELEGPGTERLIVRPGWTGVAQAMMNHWPVIDVVAAQCAYQQEAFLGNFTAVPANMIRPALTSNQLFGGSSLGSSGADGMNIITLAPGVINWANGREGQVLQIAYTNGWPHAGLLPWQVLTGNMVVSSNVITGLSSTTGMTVGQPVGSPAFELGSSVITDVVSSTSVAVADEAQYDFSSTPQPLQFGYPPGVAMLNVDDVTGFSNVMAKVYDGGATESVTITAIAATNPVTVFPGITAQAGPGTVTLATPTVRPHSGTDPPTALLTTLPDVVRGASYYFAAGEALVRGGTAITAGALPGSMQNTPGPPLTPAALNKEGERWIGRLGRAF